jgi:hypothetical protein
LPSRTRSEWYSPEYGTPAVDDALGRFDPPKTTTTATTVKVAITAEAAYINHRRDLAEALRNSGCSGSFVLIFLVISPAEGPRGYRADQLIPR